MSKTELVAAIAEKTGLTKKDSEAAVNAFIGTVTEQLKKGEKVQLIGFGTFEVSERAEHDAINPATKEKIHVPKKNAVRFSAGKALKAAVN